VLKHITSQAVLCHVMIFDLIATVHCYTYDTDFSCNEATEAIVPLNVEINVFRPPCIFGSALQHRNKISNSSRLMNNIHQQYNKPYRVAHKKVDYFTSLPTMCIPHTY